MNGPSCAPQSAGSPTDAADDADETDDAEAAGTQRMQMPPQLTLPQPGPASGTVPCWQSSVISRHWFCTCHLEQTYPPGQSTNVETLLKAADDEDDETEDAIDELEEADEMIDEDDADDTGKADD